MAQAKKRKKFFDVKIPIIGNETQLIGYNIKELDGKTIKYDLTRILKGKGVLMQLEVKVKDEKAIASPKAINLMPYFLKRMARKGTDYVEDSFSTDCKNAHVIIKPLLVTRRKVSKAVRKALRDKAKEELIAYVKDRDKETLFDEILNNKLQKSLSLKLKKIYPLSLCEIRRFKVVKDKQ
jgi:ribosomal protein S3AE|tara:strand:- start:7 stop:546 length:540 start_codon:yes stop_codon:yes gene_type:complete